MAPKSSFRSQQPSKEEEEERKESSSSGEEEEEEEEDVSEAKENSSDDETEEASSDDEGKIQGTLNNGKSPKNPVTKFESKFDSDRDSEGSPSDYMLQPIHKGSVSSSKRSRVESKDNQDSLRSGKSSKTDEKKSASSTPGGGGFTRLWSNDDEIAVLNGMIKFKTLKGLDPSADMGAFHSFVKGKLEVGFTRDQLRTKITRMKKRFFNALKKGGKGSDMATFEISKKIWGGAAAVDINEKGKSKIQKVEKDVVNEREVVEEENGGEGGDFWSKYPYFNKSFDNMKGNFPSLMTHGAGMSLMKEKLSLIGNAKAKELDDKWKQLSVEELELSCKILMLMNEQVQMTLDQ